MLLQGLGDGNIVLRAYPNWRSQATLRIIKYLNSYISQVVLLDSFED